jgi:hypothetical protein
MADIVEGFRIAAPTVIVPIGVFAGNWAFRYRSEYPQTAASEFLLAVLIFDIVAVTTAKEFEPFVHAPELRVVVIQWHIFMAFVGAGLWWAIATFGEPRLAAYYSATRHRRNLPILTLVLCWIGIFMVLSLHTGFFFVKGV